MCTTIAPCTTFSISLHLSTDTRDEHMNISLYTPSNKPISLHVFSSCVSILLLSLTHCTKYHSNGIEWGRYHDLLHMAIIQEGVWIITALCLAICWLKLLFYVKVNLQMSMLINTIGAMINKLMSFFVIFAVVLLAFICFESVAFGYKVRLLRLIRFI